MLVFTSLAAAACGAGSDAVFLAEVTDSAGVRIATNGPVSAAPASLQLDAEPYLMLGGLRQDLRLEFQGTSPWNSAVVLSDGRLVASNGTHVKFLGPDGALERIVGQEGDGPGEFRQIHGLCPLAGDSVVVWDGRVRRVTILGPHGAIVRSFPTTYHVIRDVCFADGALLVQGGRIPDLDPPRARFYTLSSTGALLDSLPVLPVASSVQVPRQVTYAVHREELYVADARHPEVRIYDRAGRLVRIVRTRDTPEVMTPEELHNANPWEGEMAAGSRSGGAVRPAAFGVTRPPHHRMLVDPEGRIWLLLDIVLRTDHRNLLGPADGVWAVFAPDGQLLARLPVDTGEGPWKQIVDLRTGRPLVASRDMMGARVLAFHDVLGLPPGAR
ncbi:MAG: hypothetical protein WEB88_09150 [Gemmatimonadota bacterium]